MDQNLSAARVSAPSSSALPQQGCGTGVASAEQHMPDLIRKAPGGTRSSCSRDKPCAAVHTWEQDAAWALERALL